LGRLSQRSLSQPHQSDQRENDVQDEAVVRLVCLTVHDERPLAPRVKNHWQVMA
jgi:hypothetical protein